MQPYFFPYLGYFDLIFNVDKWIVFDTPQYIKGGWVNRNRVLHPDKGWRYLSVPLNKHPADTPINKITICETEDWRSDMVRHLYHYKKWAPFYKKANGIVEECIAKNDSYLFRLNIRALEMICLYLEIPFQYSVFSQIGLGIEGDIEAGEWSLKISEALGASVYINPPGGRNLFDAQAFEKKGVTLVIREFENMTYSTNPYNFEPAMSIIDVMMWNSPQQIKNYLESKKM